MNQDRTVIVSLDKIVSTRDIIMTDRTDEGDKSIETEEMREISR